jgi:phage FluMu protein Com
MPRKFTTEQFIEKAITIHGDTFDYSNVEYTNDRGKVKIRCKVHGIFLQSPGNHTRGYGCKLCVSDKHTVTKDEFVARSNIIHGSKYDYSEFMYRKTSIKGIIVCPRHGKFLQTPNSHTQGSGCRQCIPPGKKLTSVKTFISKARDVHGDTYDYSRVVYVGAKVPVEIICKIHGLFLQRPDIHTYFKSKCPACSSIFTISRKETEWLDYIGLPNTTDHRQVQVFIGASKFTVDGFNSKTNTIYEFWGDFWHGNPRVFPPNGVNQCNYIPFATLYEKTQHKREVIVSAGYKLVEIWECDWDKLKIK